MTPADRGALFFITDALGLSLFVGMQVGGRSVLQQAETSHWRPLLAHRIYAS